MALSHEQKLAFIHKMTKMALSARPHYDAGGEINNAIGDQEGSGSVAGQIASAALPPSSAQGTPGQQNPYVQSNATNPNTGVLGTINAGLGLNDNFQASSANITPGTNTGQLEQSYTDAQSALANQQNLASTLAPQAATAANNQNTLANQELAMTQGGGPNPAQAQLNQNTGQNIAQTAALMAGQRGAGANAGLIADAAANMGAQTQQTAVGQEATNEANQQIAAQQNLANLSNNQISQTGQADTGLSSAEQNEQSTLQNANTSFNNAAVGMQSNINNVNSQTAAANQNMAANTLGGIGSAISSVSSMFAKGGSVHAHNHKKLDFVHKMTKMGLSHYDDGGPVEGSEPIQDVADTSAPDLGGFKANDASASNGPSVPSTSSLPADQTNFSQSMGGSSGGGGGGGGGGGLMSLAAMMAKGGEVNLGSGTYNASSASNGPSIPGTSSLPQDNINFSSQNSKPSQDKKTKGSPQSPVTGNSAVDGGGAMAGADMGAGVAPTTMMAYEGGAIWKVHPAHRAEYLNNHFKNYFEGGETKKAVPAMVSPGEVYLSPDKVHKVVHEGANPLKIGQKFAGKAKVKGDSLKNDIIPATLEEGGVVIDRKHVMNPEKAALFVHRAIAKKRIR